MYIFQEIYDKEFKNKFEDKKIYYEHRLIGMNNKQPNPLNVSRWHGGPGS